MGPIHSTTCPLSRSPLAALYILFVHFDHYERSSTITRMPTSNRSFPYYFTEREPVGFEPSVVFPVGLRSKRHEDRAVTSTASITSSRTDPDSRTSAMSAAMAARRCVAASAASRSFSSPLGMPDERRIPTFSSSSEPQLATPTTVLPKLSCMLKREFVDDSEDEREQYYGRFPSMSKQPPKRALSDAYDSNQHEEIDAAPPLKRSYSAERPTRPQYYDQPAERPSIHTTGAHHQLRDALLSRYAGAASSSVEDRFQNMRPYAPPPSMVSGRDYQRPSVPPGYETKLREGLAAATGSHSPSFAISNPRDRTLEAASELLAERSPRKREAITKLLLKSKEFLSPTSLVRNRNNEIDWVATFLSVGFEPNSIYSLMCPLRKGRWKVEEERFTLEMLRLIEIGTIRLRPGQSIRGFIAKKLHSDDMRVLKKLSNCKMFHFARAINPRMMHDDGSDSGASHEYDTTAPSAMRDLVRLEQLKNEFLRSVQLEALVAVRKYLSDSSIRELLNGQDRSSATSSEPDLCASSRSPSHSNQIFKYGEH